MLSLSLFLSHSPLMESVAKSDTNQGKSLFGYFFHSFSFTNVLSGKTGAAVAAAAAAVATAKIKLGSIFGILTLLLLKFATAAID